MNAEEILLAAVEKQTPAERAAYLNRACGSDAALRALVEGLLRSHEAAGSFLEQPLFEPSPTRDQVPHSEKPSTVIGPYKLLQQIGELAGGIGQNVLFSDGHVGWRRPCGSGTPGGTRPRGAAGRRPAAAAARASRRPGRGRRTG